VRFCPYCQNFRGDVGFKVIVHFKTQSKRGMCPHCQEVRKRPRADLIAEAGAEKLKRKKK
jgi:hypothetical protein